MSGSPGGGFGPSGAGSLGTKRGGGSGPPGGFGPPPAAPTRPPPKRDHSKKVFFLAITGAVLFMLISCCGLLIFAGVEGNRDREQFAALGAACDGRAVAGPQAHPAPHPRLRVMERDGRGGWRMATVLTPNDYRAHDLADVSVVLCMDEAREFTVDRCEFVDTMWGIDVPDSQHGFPRTQQRAPVRLVSASTGVAIATGEVGGRLPSCDAFSGDEPSEDDFEGEDIGEADVRAWLAQQLPPP